jgi:hypothetical protein
MNTPMDEEREHDRGLEGLLERAYPGPDCPAPEVYLRDAVLSDDERARVEAHARTCPGCAAERALARSFDEQAGVSEDAEAIVRQLREDAPWKKTRSAAAPQTESGRHTPGWGRAARQGRRRRSFMGLPIAMAAGVLLVLGAALQLLGPHAPPIGAPGSGTAMRGSEIEAISPSGDVTVAPQSLDWRQVQNAVSYRVSILGVDGEPLWNETVSGSPATLPESESSALHASVLYRWQVEAFDANGVRIAWSKPTPFRITAQGNEPPGQ